MKRKSKWKTYKGETMILVRDGTQYIKKDTIIQILLDAGEANMSLVDVIISLQNLKVK